MFAEPSVKETRRFEILQKLKGPTSLNAPGAKKGKK
jgi:hypothetical protein